MKFNLLVIFIALCMVGFEMMRVNIVQAPLKINNPPISFSYTLINENVIHILLIQFIVC